MVNLLLDSILETKGKLERYRNLLTKYLQEKWPVSLFGVAICKNKCCHLKSSIPYTNLLVRIW